ncbi:MAG: hypothetical protein ABI165_07155 [Bryobacteraceae bacterium]
MKSLRLVGLLAVLCCAVFPQSTTDVGTGSPDDGIRNQFIAAYFRNLFYTHVTMPPLNAVHTFGGTGLVQEFSPAGSGSTGKYALVKSTTADISPNSIDPVEQVLPAMYAFYTSVGPNTAGFPTNDTQTCPPLSNPSNSCLYQLFDKNYALFVYQTGVLSGQNFSVADPYYTKWSTLGGIGVFGPAASAQTAVTSSLGSAATLQSFDQGAIFNITSGTLSGRLVAVAPPVYTAYVAAGSYQGQFGFPANAPVLLPNGDYSQSFESGGSIEYNPNSPGGAPIVHFPIGGLSVTPSASPVKLNLGATFTLTASVFDVNGTQVTDRPVIWTTSNGSVASIQPSGATVVVTAVGGGSANVTATSGGRSTPVISFFVTAPCCQIGDGAPTASVRQALQDAVTRNRLTVMLPAGSPVTRVGPGYMQLLQPANPSSASTTYLIAVSDQLGVGYLVTGPILAAYQILGGPAGPLGYPASDPTAGGRQLFLNGIALAGMPVQQVTGSILAKWASLGYETGVAGSPAGPSAAFLTFRGTRGQLQPFQNALIAGASTGPQAGKTFLVSGLTLAAYNAAGGPSGNLGAPLDDEGTGNGRRHQDFEGGAIDYASGDAAAVVTQSPRQPLVIASPATVLSGATVQLSVGGFDNGATIRVSVSGQPDFIVNTATGAYAWSALVPTGAKSGVVAIQAKDVNSGASAQGSYTIAPLASAHLQLSIVSGDAQTGAPGAALAQPLVISLVDSAGNPAPGVPVQFAASPGGRISPASSVTDAAGHAMAALRLPVSSPDAQASVALATASAAGQVVTFSARAVPASLTNFPALSQVSGAMLGNGKDTLTAKGALLTAVAGILRYRQNRGELPEPNGPADPVTLNQFLTSFCVFDAQGVPICDGFVTPAGSTEPIVNLWRVGAFVNGNVTVQVVNPSLPAIRDLIAQGSPVLLALSLSSGQTPLGAHFVVGTGIAGDGSILIADPNPVFGRANLNDYLTGFTTASQTATGTPVTGTLVAALRLIPQAPNSAGFLVISGAPVNLTSPAGVCGATASWPAVTAIGVALAQPAGAIGFLGCSGQQPIYQLDIGSTNTWAASFTDLGSPGYHADLNGSGPSSFQVTRPVAQWNIAPLAVSVSASGVVNAASFTADLAPGGFAAVYGSGFVQAGAPVTVQVNGVSAPVVASSPFQLNVAIPAGIAPGMATLQVASSTGSSSQSIQLLANAPEIFSVALGQAAIVNQDNSLNTTANPAARGSVIVIYATGLGAVTEQGGLSPAAQPVTVVLGSAGLPVAYAGLTPGFVGLYQINLFIPSGTPPDLTIPLYLMQAGAASKPVSVSIQ